MKKLLLFPLFLLMGHMYLQAQIIVYCETPAAAMGNKGFTWANPGGGWGTADLNIPANSVKDTLMLVDDGTAGDSAGCGPLVNSLKGKIAVVYRGACEFGVKAKNAQDSGAVGVIIINNVAGAPIGLGPGAQGASVTIPTVMVSDADGAVLRAAMNAGSDVVVFIGNKFGLYNNDLGLYAIDLLVPRVTANPALISASATEFNVPMGGWIHNYGISSQSNVTLDAAISGAATYSAASTPVTLAPGDSVYVTIPTYSAASYSGLYELNYSINYGNTDDFAADNSFYANFLIDSLLSYCLIDKATEMPKSSVHYKINSSPAPLEYKTCIHFMDPNASRIAALGLYTSATTSVTLSLPGESLDALAYEWNDVFTGLSDPAFPAGVWNLNQLEQGTYTYSNDLQGEMIYIPFPKPVHLLDNQRYLFCTRTFSSDVNLGFDAHYNYLEVIDTVNGNDQPISIVITDTDNYATGFGTDATSSVSVLFGDQFSSVNEHHNSFEVTPFPNPATEYIQIPLKGMKGTAVLNIMDIDGKIVGTQSLKVTDKISVNVNGIANGNYVFKMVFEDGKTTSFKVVITK